jgi:uncharacterized membrane protein
MKSERSGSGALDVLGAFGAGVAVMYFLDPGRGARRRALVRDKLVHGLHKGADAAETTARDLRNRAQGIVAEVRARFDGGTEVDDAVLVARVRAEMGRVVSHPSSIVVTAADGRVTLSGPILSEEAGALLACARGVRGVEDVVDRLEVHERAENVPGLQGGVSRRGPEFELLQENWTPAARLAVGAVGGALALGGARRHDLLGAAMSLTGLVLLTRSATNAELRTLVGAGARGIEVQKAINVNAPIDDVFAFFTNYENFPRFMSHVREVRDTGGDTSHWTVDGPAGVPVEWDAVLTDLVPNEVIGWTSVPGSVVHSAGVIRFAQNADGTTHVDLKMTYTPPAGAIGHAAAKLLGADPKKQMDDDLARAKTFLETGTPPRDAAQQARS